MIADWLHSLIRTSHIVLGSIGLLMFWIPALARKGSRLHIASGRFFGYLSYAIAATAAVSCLWAITAPLSFTGITRELAPDEQRQLFGNVRFLFVILFTLMTWLVSGTAMGSHVARHKNDFRNDAGLARFCWIISGITSLMCGLFGISILVVGETNGLLPLILGWVGTTDSKKNLQLLSQPTQSPRLWLEKHIECMIGCGIAMHTAFFVFGAKGLFGLELSGLLALIPWLLPTVIGITAITILTQRLRKSVSRPEQTTDYST